MGESKKETQEVSERYKEEDDDDIFSLPPPGSVRVDRGQAQAHRLLLVVNSELREITSDPQHMTFDPQLRSMLQWAAASIADLPMVQLGHSDSWDLQQVSGFNLNTQPKDYARTDGRAAASVITEVCSVCPSSCLRWSRG